VRAAGGAGSPASPDAAEAVPFELEVAELKERLDRGEAIRLVDVREPFEWRIANLGAYGASMIPLGDVPDRLDELDPDGEIILYCRSGARSADVTRYLRSLGYAGARNLRGGILAWSEEIDPSIPRY
jgi:sulfur-carrier protein adenylyltransferase/sulfurtransferase